MPAYVKSHSRGEYVFDHGWAEAFERAGGRYYPKLQLAFPFTPATGRRFMGGTPEDAAMLISGAEAVCRQHGLSSAHATFLPADQRDVFERAGWLLRSGEQFHWFNRNYRDFDDFLSALSSRKRKAIRKERAGAAAHDLEIVQLEGRAIGDEHWDAFWDFYQDTGARKWGTPYLTRACFSLLGELIPDRLVMFLARHQGEPVAGALNFLGDDCLYGRYWGALADVPFLHFELCYYRAIELAIERGLARVEAGAQGPHKLARGYEPVKTYSAHWIANPGLRAAIGDYLEQEREMVDADVAALSRHTPFKRG